MARISLNSSLPPEETLTATERYHLAELRIAVDPHDARRLLPAVPEGCRRILDVGCGAGQTLVAMQAAAWERAVGIDCDAGALRLGRRCVDGVDFALASGESLPFAGGSFDFVYSRVALPYMDIPRALAEMARVLEPGGGLWLTLHPPAWAGWRYLLRSPRRIVFEAYRLSNTLLFHVLGRTIRFPLKRATTESFQTEKAMRRALRQSGFEQIRFVREGAHFLVTARKEKAG